MEREGFAVILAIVGTVVGIIGLLFAWYSWTHESPRLRHDRESQLEAVAVKAAEIALTRERENREPGRPITPAEREKISADAHQIFLTGIASGASGAVGNLKVVPVVSLPGIPSGAVVGNLKVTLGPVPESEKEKRGSE